MTHLACESKMFARFLLVLMGGAVACGPRGQESETCAALLACLEAAGAGELAKAEETYGPDGSCWAGDPTGKTCEDACEADLQVASEDSPETLECWLGGSPNMGLIFPTETRWSVDPSGSSGWRADVDVAYITGDSESGGFSLTFEYGNYSESDCGEELDERSWKASCTMGGLAFECGYTYQPYSAWEDVVVTGEFDADFNAGSLVFTPCAGDDDPCSLAGAIQH